MGKNNTYGGVNIKWIREHLATGREFQVMNKTWTDVLNHLEDLTADLSKAKTENEKLNTELENNSATMCELDGEIAAIKKDWEKATADNACLVSDNVKLQESEKLSARMIRQQKAENEKLRTTLGEERNKWHIEINNLTANLTEANENTTDAMRVAEKWHKITKLNANLMAQMTKKITDLQAKVEANRWIPVDEGLPKDAKRVEVIILTENNKRWSTVAQYVKKRTILAEDFIEEFSDFHDYDEDADVYYAPEGWYEACFESEINMHLSATVTYYRSITLPESEQGNVPPEPIENRFSHGRLT